MKTTLPFIFALLVFPAIALGNNGLECDPPYEPTNFIKVLFFYKTTMTYIANAPQHCRRPFARKVKQVVRSSFLLTEGCMEATLEDINEALFAAPETPEKKSR